MKDSLNFTTWYFDLFNINDQVNQLLLKLLKISNVSPTCINVIELESGFKTIFLDLYHGIY